MNAKQSMAVMAMHGAIVLSVVVATVILGVQGTLDSSSVLGILGAAIGFAGGTAASLGSLGAAVNGKSVITPQMISEQGAMQRTAMLAAASAPSHIVEASEPTTTSPEE